MRAAPTLAGARRTTSQTLARQEAQARADVETILRAEDGFCGGRLGDDDEAPSSAALRRARRDRLVHDGCMAACLLCVAFLVFVIAIDWRF